MRSLMTGSWPDLQYQVCVSSWGVGSKADEKGVGYPRNNVPLLCPWWHHPHWLTGVTAKGDCG